ncbi:MAG: DUF1295 domain-containing protein [Clostridia bacterium]|nr:DUF1295 domain-containing protein [Clostridia bacterium]
MKEKNKGMLVDLAVYAAAFAAGLVPYLLLDDMFAATAVFTAAATVIVFIASCVFSDVSVYDPYWSVAPPVMLLLNMIRYRLWNVNSLILFCIVMLWAVRLTGNWYVTYKGIGNEDWRYAMYRKRYPSLLFHLISFTGLHFVPTIVVYLGLVSGLFAIREKAFAPLSMIGAAVMLAAVLLEFVSDRAIHRFLREHEGEHRTCDISVWKYSRHPNYLGEMSFWTGMYLYFAACCPRQWYRGLGFLSIILLFLVVSIPMMEKHNMQRRADYEAYKARTSVLIPLPNRKQTA